ncbi:hypothetical protein DFP73DRAFT_285885 [Morchella snyderi]|nr:hypothetical protein DFP73DRAFT_285885 [Morchella snyderi]
MLNSTMDLNPLRDELDELRSQIADLQRKVAEHKKDEQEKGRVGRGVYLGLLRARDLDALSDRALNELDDGLKAIALHLVPRGTAAPSANSEHAPLPRLGREMVALLNKLSLKVDPVPGFWTVHFEAFRDPARGRDLRLDDARQGVFGMIEKKYRANMLYFETFLQLVHFRGIDLEALA